MSKFITFEGGEGSGKTSVITGINRLLREFDLNCLTTREPGGTPLAESLRSLVCEPQASGEMITPISEFLIIAAARAQHIQHRIQPALAQGKWVLCDRFYDSSAVYQGLLGGIAADLIHSLNQACCRGTHPDLTLVLDCPPSIALERMQKRGQALSRFDQKGIEFHNTVRDGFLELAKNHSSRIEVVDATQPPNQVLEQCFNIICQRFSLR